VITPAHKLPRAITLEPGIDSPRMAFEHDPDPAALLREGDGLDLVLEEAFLHVLEGGAGERISACRSRETRRRRQG
jgi:hypothetical protein